VRAEQLDGIEEWAGLRIGDVNIVAARADYAHEMAEQIAAVIASALRAEHVRALEFALGLLLKCDDEYELDAALRAEIERVGKSK